MGTKYGDFKKLEDIQKIPQFKTLTKKQKSLLIHYFGDAKKNKRQAALMAGYSPKSAHISAEKFFKDPRVIKITEILDKKEVDKHIVLKNQITAELCKMAFSNITQFMSWANSCLKIKDSDEIAPEYTDVIEEVSEVLSAAGSTMKIKPYSKIQAIRELNKMYGLYAAEKVEVENPDGNMKQTTVVILPSNGREAK